MMVFALTFGLPALLWGLGLASAPVIIHLLNRRRHKVTQWAAMKWLLEAIKKRNRRIQMEQWLLLALRTLVIILVILAMSKPTFETARAMFIADTPATHHILVFDNSMSMHYALANWNRWERAKGMAQAILDDAQTGDQASVVVMGVASTILVGDPSPYLRDVTEEIDAIKPEHGTARIETAIDQVGEILKISRATKRRIYLITDMQRGSWLGEDADKDYGEFGRKLRALGEQADFTILDVGGESVNHAVVNLEMVEPLAVLNRPVVLRATIVNFATAPTDEFPVELQVDGQVEAVQSVSIPPGEQKVVSFNVSFREPGDRVVTVRAGEDALRIDDRRSLVVKVRQSLSVLIIEGEPSGEPFQSESDYLKIALAPNTNGGDATLIRPEVRLESDLLESDLDDWDIVILCNVGQLTSVERNRLDDYLKHGGGVIFFLGTQTNLAAYNELLYEDGKGPLPARLVDVMGEEVRGEKSFRFDPLGYVHPIVQLFRDREDAGLLSTRVQRYVKAVLPPGSAARVALAYNTGDPAVILASCARGHVALVTTSASIDWSTWPISHSFVPVVQELARQMILGRVRTQPTLVGEPLIVPVPRETSDSGNFMVPPGEESGPLPVKLEEVSGTRSAVFAETNRTGIYKLALAGVDGEWPFAVNSWPRESDLARMTADELKTMFPGWEFAITDRWDEAQAVASAGPSVSGEFHRPLLYAALAILFLETWLARRFSHHA